MRISPLRHPLAVLRTDLGLTQRELGDLVKRSRVTIQAVELGKLPLSEGLAMKISAATGVAVGWLLSGDPSTGPPATQGGFLTRAKYERHRAGVEARWANPREGDELLTLAFHWLLARTAEKPERELVRWKLRQALNSVYQTCGTVGTERAIE